MRKNRNGRFDKLKSLLKSKNCSYDDLACALNLSLRQVCRLLSGETDWNLSKIYEVVDLLKIPYEQIAEYFPSDRKNAQV